MPKHYCDYCDVFLTHDSTSVRKAHNSGRNHLSNVRDYYASLGHDKAQNIIDQITSAYESGGPPPGGFGFGPQHLGGPPPGFGAPPMGYGGQPMPPPGFGGRFPPMMPPGAPPFPPNNMPPGMGGPPAGFGTSSRYIYRTVQPTSRSGAPPFPPNGPPGGMNEFRWTFSPQNASSAPPNSNPSQPVPPTIHPDRLRMMGGR
ncbi:U1 small nuclear ribonucleoprotein C [Pholiota molesta]|nr:U1 small nuclear ribonucleoprotein C [Pholiota molesta]